MQDMHDNKALGGSSWHRASHWIMLSKSNGEAYPTESLSRTLSIQVVDFALCTDSLASAQSVKVSQYLQKSGHRELWISFDTLYLDVIHSFPRHFAKSRLEKFTIHSTSVLRNSNNNSDTSAISSIYSSKPSRWHYGSPVTALS